MKITVLLAYVCVGACAVSISHQLVELTGLSATFRGAKEKLLRVDKHIVIHIYLDMTGYTVTNKYHNT